LDVAFVEVGERIGIIGALVNLGLSGLKFTVGALVGSVALVADGLHSLSDLLTDLVVVVGMRLGRRPPDHHKVGEKVRKGVKSVCDQRHRTH